MLALGPTLGILEITVLISTFLYGVSTLQTFLYIEHDFKDSMLIRIMVGIISLFDTTHTISMWTYLYGLTVTHYGSLSIIFTTPWSLAISVACVSIISSGVQAFLAYRVRVLSGQMCFPIIAWSLAILHCGMGIAVTILCVKDGMLPTFFSHFQWLVTTDLVLHVAVDVLNTLSLCYYLLHRQSGYKPTQKVVSRLILYTLENGMITSLCSAGVLISTLVMKTNLVYLGLLMVYPKLFANTLLASLNARQTLRQSMVPDSVRVWRPVSAPVGSISADPGILAGDSEMELSPRDSKDITSLTFDSECVMDPTKRDPLRERVPINAGYHVQGRTITGAFTL